MSGKTPTIKDAARIQICEATKAPVSSAINKLGLALMTVPHPATRFVGLALQYAPINGALADVASDAAASGIVTGVEQAVHRTARTASNNIVAFTAGQAARALNARAPVAA